MTDLTHKQLVEKVARALCAVDYVDPDAPGEMKGEQYSPWWREAGYAAYAEAAIATIRDALKEPTEAMYRPGHEAMFSEPYDASTDVMIGAGWDAMLLASPLYEEGK